MLKKKQYLSLNKWICCEAAWICPKKHGSSKTAWICLELGQGFFSSKIAWILPKQPGFVQKWALICHKVSMSFPKQPGFVHKQPRFLLKILVGPKTSLPCPKTAWTCPKQFVFVLKYPRYKSHLWCKSCSFILANYPA